MKKGYIIIEVIVSITCIMILILPIFKTISLINRDRENYKNNKSILITMDMSKEYIQELKNETDLLPTNSINGYDVSVQLERKITDKLYKYKVDISKNDNKEAEFYIIKRYE